MAGTSRRAQGGNIRSLDTLGREVAAAITAVLDQGGPAEIILTRSAIRVTNRVKQEIQHVGGGRTYRRGTIEHRASAPGEAPATDRGRLVQSYDWRVGRDSRGIFVEIGSNSEYAPDLEIGTRDMEPRPALRTAIAAERDHLMRDVVDAVASAQRAAIARMPKVVHIK